MKTDHAQALVWTGIWLVLVITALFIRPPLPMDETRYLSVAWEMWSRGDYWVPYLNGEPYSHKPPLLFWLMHAGWSVFGVNEFWPRMIAPLFGLAALFLTRDLARQLWPGDKAIESAAPLLLMASGFWALFTTLTMFDMLLAALAVLGLWGTVRAWRHGDAWGWIALAFSIGLGLLAKGPAILLHVLIAPALAPLWAPLLNNTRGMGWGRWYSSIGVALIVGLAMALVWAIPAGLKGGDAYFNAIFWGQTAGRMVDSFAHGRPLWWYLAVLPVLLLPLLVWPSLWRSVRRLEAPLDDGGLRFCLAWFLPVFVVFSLISGKQLHYLLPVFPALALMAAFALSADAGQDGEHDQGAHRDLLIPGLFVVILGIGIGVLALGLLPVEAPDWMTTIDVYWSVLPIGAGLGVALWPCRGGRVRLNLMAGLAALLVVFVHLAARPVLERSFDLRPLATQLAAWESQGLPLVHYGKYHGQFHFLGRLTRPIGITGDQEVKAWIAQNPNGKIITIQKQLPEGGKPDFVQPFRRKLITVWDADVVRHDLRLVKRPPG